MVELPRLGIDTRVGSSCGHSEKNRVVVVVDVVVVVVLSITGDDDGLMVGLYDEGSSVVGLDEVGSSVVHGSDETGDDDGLMVGSEVTGDELGKLVPEIGDRLGGSVGLAVVG